MSSTSSFAVSPEEMANLVGLLAQASENIDQRLGELERSSAANLAQWSGHAQYAYAEQKASWDRAAMQMNELLMQASKTLDSVTQNYVNAEQANLKKWMNL